MTCPGLKFAQGLKLNRIHHGGPPSVRRRRACSSLSSTSPSRNKSGIRIPFLIRQSLSTVTTTNQLELERHSFRSSHLGDHTL
ncbi:hypothetical protein K443DRAFT_327544 [Laccaria amethystina LaAM-08-1]|uniref:Uncharacterized protein n=1 Tax=Laccaria amethystina LaAM-08-1 TaxID=1095629 RepID=A0A0C9YCB6_9AGAR|nr:hypothetical protein K443DRAFT_327544 [Laccaria amethystina LaAM-08-1]